MWDLPAAALRFYEEAPATVLHPSRLRDRADGIQRVVAPWLDDGTASNPGDIGPGGAWL